MPTELEAKRRRRGRPAQINMEGTQSLLCTHCTATSKIALIEEANSCEMSLSLYTAMLIEGLTRDQRLAAAAKAVSDGKMPMDPVMVKILNPDTSIQMEVPELVAE